VQERRVMLQFRSFAVGREGELTAAPAERLEHFTHPVKTLTVWRYLFS